MTHEQNSDGVWSGSPRVLDPRAIPAVWSHSQIPNGDRELVSEALAGTHAARRSWASLPCSVLIAARYGLTGSTILFGLLAAYNLVALLTRWLFADYWWIRQRVGLSQSERN